MAVLYLGLGSNLGNRREWLEKAIDEIGKEVGPIVARASFYETEAWGFQSENRFVNACVAVDTPFSPEECLQRTQAIERRLGRTHKTVGRQYADRCIDIDLLLFEGETRQTESLVLPHPLMKERAFVMDPLREIAPELADRIEGR